MVAAVTVAAAFLAVVVAAVVATAAILSVPAPAPVAAALPAVAACGYVGAAPTCPCYGCAGEEPDSPGRDHGCGVACGHG